MSSERVKEIRMQTARELEKRGLVDKAVSEYVKAGAPGEAARLLVSKERYRDAGALMLQTLGVEPDTAGTLEGPARQAALKAARCFELGGDADTAARIQRSLGGAPAPVAAAAAAPATAPAAAAPSAAAPASSPRLSMRPSILPETAPRESLPPRERERERDPSGAPPEARSQPEQPPQSSAQRAAARPSVAPSDGKRAEKSTGEKWGRASGWRSGSGDTSAQDEMIRQLLDQGKKASAARVAWDAGRLEDAAAWFEEAGLDYETGAVLFDLGRFEPALEKLLRVPPEHKRYRVACTKMLEIATRLGRLDFELDRALAQVAKAPPVDASEIPTYLAIGELYAKHGFADGARAAIEQVLLFDSSNDAARAALEALPPTPAGGGTPSERPKRRSSRAPRRIAPPVQAGSRALPPLPSLDEFVAEARRLAPKPEPKRAP